MSNLQIRGLIALCAAGIIMLPAGGFSAGAAPDYYAGWTVGALWDGYGTILRSTDSGNAWTRQGAGQIVDVAMEGVVAVDPYTAWVVGDSDGYATIYHTTDGGNTWARKGSPADIPDVGLSKVHAPDDNHVWAVGCGAIIHTGDGGATWTNQIPAGYESVILQGVYAPDNNTVWVTGNHKDGYPTILKSTNAGQSWSRQSAMPGQNHILGISAVDTETAWAIGGKDATNSWFVIKTGDGGDTWIQQTEGAHDGNNVCAVDTSTVWTASDSVICWSTDGGATWGAHHSDEYTMGISAVSSQQAWAVSWYGWKGSIRHTTDGGINWTVLTELGGEELPALSTVSFSSQTVPAPTPEYIVLESGDYNGDGKAEIAIFRPSTGLWAVRGLGRIYFGTRGDIPVSGDYNGDGCADVSVFRPSSGLWAVKNVTRLYFGGSNDLPVPGDYDGDGCCDVAVFGQQLGQWRIRGISSVYYGTLGDRPAPSDYDGDGSTDIAIFRPASGLWAVRDVTRCYFGASGDTPVPGVFKWYGAGLTTGIINDQYTSAAGQKAGPFRNQVALFRPATGLWAIRGHTRFYFGSDGNSPVIGDFNGNSLDDTIIFNPSSALWAIKGVTRVYFGTIGDIPVTR